MKELAQDIVIMRAFLHNLEEIQDIASATFAESFALYNTPEDMQHYLEVNLSQAQLGLEIESQVSSFYLVKKSTAIVGYLKVNNIPAKGTPNAEKGLELERIYLLKQHQQHGIGQVLFDFVKNLAVENRADYLWLGVWEHNERAIRFYERNHMQRFGTHSFVLGKDEQTDILMRLDV